MVLLLNTLSNFRTSFVIYLKSIHKKFTEVAESISRLCHHMQAANFPIKPARQARIFKSISIFNDILHMSFLAGTHVFKAYPAYTTTEI